MTLLLLFSYNANYATGTLSLSAAATTTHTTTLSTSVFSTAGISSGPLSSGPLSLSIECVPRLILSATNIIQIRFASEISLTTAATTIATATGSGIGTFTLSTAATAIISDLLTATGSFAIVAPVLATWVSRTGAGQRSWSSIAVSPDGTKQAATAVYVYTSTDSGATWTEQTTSGFRAWIDVAISSDGTKIAGSVIASGHIYISTNSGASWTPTGTNLGTASASSDFSKLAATGTYINTSINNGSNWTPQIGSGARNWSSIASSSDGTTLIAGDYGGYIYKSTDSGVTFTPCANSGTINWLNIALSGDGTKLAAIVYNGAIITSSDGGATWLIGAVSGWNSIAYSLDGTILAAGDDHYIYLSTDNGVTWVQQNYVLNNGWHAIGVSADGSKFTAVQNGGYIWTGTPSANTTQINYINAVPTLSLSISVGVSQTGSQNATATPLITLDVATTSSEINYATAMAIDYIVLTGVAVIDQGDVDTTIASIDLSTTASASQAMLLSAAPSISLAASAAFTNTEIETGSGILLLTLQATILQSKNLTATPRLFISVQTTCVVKRALNATPKLLMSAHATGASAQMMTAAATFQAYWSALNWVSLGVQQVGSGICSSSNGSFLAAIGPSGVLSGLIFTSSDAGLTWTQQSNGGAFPASPHWSSIACSGDGTKLAVCDAPGYIWTSPDSGVTWTQQASGALDWSSICTSADGTTLAACDASPGFIWTSTDSGVTWTQSASMSAAWQQIICSSNGMILVAIGNSYIYTSNNGGITWTQQTGAGNTTLYDSVSGSWPMTGVDGYQDYVGSGTPSTIIGQQFKPTASTINSVQMVLTADMPADGGSVIVYLVPDSPAFKSTGNLTGAITLGTINDSAMPLSSYVLGNVPPTQMTVVLTFSPVSVVPGAEYWIVLVNNPTSTFGWWSGHDPSSGNIGTTGQLGCYNGGGHFQTWNPDGYFVCQQAMVITSGSGGQAWQSVTVSADGSHLAAVTTTNIYTSIDYGTSWTQRAPTSTQWSTIVSSADGTRLVAFDYASGYIWISPNSGATWTQQATPGTGVWTGGTVSSDGSRLVAIESTASTVYWSGTIYPTALTVSSNSTQTLSLSAAPSISLTATAIGAQTFPLIATIALPFSITATTAAAQTISVEADILVSDSASVAYAQVATAVNTFEITAAAIGANQSSLATATGFVLCAAAVLIEVVTGTISETAHAADSVVAHHVTTVQVIETFGGQQQGKILFVVVGETLDANDNPSASNPPPIPQPLMNQLSGFSMAGGGTVARRQPETVIRVRITSPDDIEESKQYTYKIRRPVVSALIESSPPVQPAPKVTLNAINHVLFR